MLYQVRKLRQSSHKSKWNLCSSNLWRYLARSRFSYWTLNQRWADDGATNSRVQDKMQTQGHTLVCVSLSHLALFSGTTQRFVVAVSFLRWMLDIFPQRLQLRVNAVSGKCRRCQNCCAWSWETVTSVFSVVNCVNDCESSMQSLCVFLVGNVRWTRALVFVVKNLSNEHSSFDTARDNFIWKQNQLPITEQMLTPTGSAQFQQHTQMWKC